ncbi:MAG TPA: rhodanese family protein [Rhizomicrobium sp.]|nr:rhodanese family protein [Rhizomicrobium sp.]
MSLPVIDAAEAKKLMAAKGAVLVDIREAQEHARESIPGARTAPLSTLESQGIAACGAPVIFHCQSGNRTNVHTERLSACAPSEAYVLKGGLMGWKAAGLPTSVDRSKPIELQRQVQIAAGSLVLIGLVLAVFVSVWFAALSGFVGAGLVFAGISGWCGMARLLAAMPWNRAAA